MVRETDLCFALPQDAHDFVISLQGKGPKSFVSWIESHDTGVRTPGGPWPRLSPTLVSTNTAMAAVVNFVSCIIIRTGGLVDVVARCQEQ